MDFVKRNHDAIIEYLEDLDDATLVQHHNQYCENTRHSDDMIYVNDEEFFEINYSDKAYDALRAAHYGEYNWNDKWVRFNGQANLQSFNDPEDDVDFNDIAADILENERKYSGFVLEDEDEDSDEQEFEPFDFNPE